ncbi:hypothetical protein HPB48_011051 [Haemaphysalis longicornis]|uniref:Uncharacterized protein n=1 Tax=Haemaphysalis longicornis TaxID=44386 RepID=A0A9J6GWA9_HAELO|nr:hypothetical protein HPB48_011051 [Haemaphysalis longicornis]
MLNFFGANLQKSTFSNSKNVVKLTASGLAARGPRRPHARQISSVPKQPSIKNSSPNPAANLSIERTGRPVLAVNSISSVSPFFKISRERLTFPAAELPQNGGRQKYLRRLLTKTHKQAEVSPVYVVRQTRHSKCIAWPDEGATTPAIRQIEFLCCACDEQRKPSDNIVPTEGLPRLPSPATRNHSLSSRATLTATSGGYASFFSTRFRGFLSSQTRSTLCVRRAPVCRGRPPRTQPAGRGDLFSPRRGAVKMRSSWGGESNNTPISHRLRETKRRKLLWTRAPLSVDTRKNLCAPENASSPVSLLPATKNWGPSPAKERRVTRADVCVKWPSERIPAQQSPVSPVDPARKALFVSRPAP